MRKYIYIFIGGMLGAVLRFTIHNIHILNYQGKFPLNTLVINITGCFILALFITIVLEVLDIDADIRLGIATGFIGAYTTFSTFCKETVVLIVGGEYFSAIFNIVSSTILGLAATYLGIIVARGIITKIARGGIKQNESEIINEVEFK